MASDFPKQLIALLAAAGGSITISLADLAQLGIELTLTDVGGSDATMRLRLGPKIYYVPEATKEGVWPTSPASPTTPVSPQPSSPTTTERVMSSRLASEIDSINNLNNRPRQPRSPLPSSDSAPESELPSASTLAPQTEASRQEAITAPPNLLRRVIPKTDMDLFLREQQIASQKEAASQRRQARERQRGRQFPWETRNVPPIKYQ